MQGHDLAVIPDRTLTFEHSSTFWGSHRTLRVPVQPTVTLGWQHVPPRCRGARALLLGPLMPADLDPASFLRPQRWWERALGVPPTRVALMAQGLQRSLGAGGLVQALGRPAPQLQAALAPHVSVFLSGASVERGRGCCE